MNPPDTEPGFTPTGIDSDFAGPADWARLYRLRGIQVVPAWMPGEPPGDTPENPKWKRPYLKEWVEFQEALIPEELFAQWYAPSGQYAHRSNMGAITGRASNNLLVIDLDDYKNLGAKEWWDELVAVENNRIEPETVEQRTGGGGRQKIFRAPPGWAVPNKNIHSMGIDIKGQGGFVMLPPSRHASGNDYEWAEGQSPDDIPIAMAPDWLLDAVEKLVRQHGGVTGGNGGFQIGHLKSAVTPHGAAQGVYDPLSGRQIDGRESRMSTMIWAAILDWYRERYVMGKEEIPTEAESLAREQEKYAIYVDLIGPKADEDGIPLKRGPEAFHVKWCGDMRKWHGKVREEALKGPPPKEGGPATVIPFPTDKPLILTGTEFVGTYRPPDYLIDGLIQKGYLYSLTGPTGHGKTPTAMLMGVRVALGRPFHGKPTTQGSVVFLAGENSDDIRARYVALSDHEKFDIATTPFYFIDGVINIQAELQRIEAEAARIPNLSMVIIDTDQAYFLGDEGNSNEQRKWFAQTLRQLLKLPGNPTALVNCHPVKNATQDNLVPLGGSSFLNEVDGNIQCWAEDRTCTIKPHSTKWRGVPFESVAFELRTVTSDRLKDTKGRHIPSVMAVEITEEGAARRASVTEEDDKSVLRMIHRDKQASLVSVAKALSWFWPDGMTPAKSKVARVIERLKVSKLVFNAHGGKYQITKKGCKLIGELWKDEEE